MCHLQLLHHLLNQLNMDSHWTKYRHFYLEKLQRVRRCHLPMVDSEYFLKFPFYMLE
jgi:hypothetical protein